MVKLALIGAEMVLVPPLMVTGAVMFQLPFLPAIC